MKSGENFNYSPKDYKFDPEGYNVDNEFERILREAGVKMTDNDKKIGDKKFNPPTISSEPFSASKDNLNIPNFNKKSPASEFNSPENTFKIPDLSRKTTSEHPEVPNFAKKVSSEAQDDYRERKDTNEHEKNIKDRQFGQRIEEVHDFTQKFNRAMKIHLRNTKREMSDRLSEKAEELSEKIKSAFSSIRERLGDKKEDFKKVGKNAFAVTLALTTVVGIGIGSRQLKKGGTTVEETTLGYEGDAIIHDKELQDEVGEKTGEKIEEIRVDNEGNVVFVANEKKEEELSSTHDNEEGETHLSPSEDDIAGEPITSKPENIPESDTSIPSVQEEATQESTNSETETSPTEEAIENETQESFSESRAEKLTFAKENISPKEAYSNIQSFIDNKEYLNIEGECTADYVAYVLSKTGHSAVQTAAYLGNMAKESKICALLYEVGGDGYGLFQYTAANRHGIKGKIYPGNIYPCEHDGYEVWIEKNDADVYRYEFEKNPFANVKYDINAEKTEKILEETGTRNLYKKAIARQIQYFYYGLASSNWERQQFDKANSATDASTYAKLFEKHVERPASTSDAEKRASVAREAYRLLTGGESLYDLKIG